MESINVSSDKSWFQNIVVDCSEVNFKLDSGAEVNVIPQRCLADFEKKYNSKGK